MTCAEVKVLAVGTALPGPPIGNAALARALHLGASFQQWVDIFVGTRTRHLAVDLATGEVRTSLADLAATAAERAIAAAGLAPGDIDLMVMGTAMPDSLMPATVNMVADRVAVDGVPTFQLQSGCTGAVQALDLASQLLIAGRHRTALVIGGEICAKHVDLTLDYARMAPGEIVNVMLFGDGAGAAVLTTGPAPDAPEISDVLVRLTGLGQAPGQTVEWFGQGDRPGQRPAVHEDFKTIETRVPGLAEEVLAELLAARGWERTDIDYLLPPQLSVRMCERILEQLKVPGVQDINCVGEIGNTGNALPFFQLEKLLPVMQPGERAVAVAVESSKWIKAGFVLERR